MGRGAWRAAIDGVADVTEHSTARVLSALLILFSYSEKFSVKVFSQRKWNYYVRDKIFRKFRAYGQIS